MSWVRGKTILRDIDGDGSVDVAQFEFLNKEAGQRQVFEHAFSYGVSEAGEVISDERRPRDSWTEEDLNELAAKIAAANNL